jgi:hypothetical protein
MLPRNLLMLKSKNLEPNLEEWDMSYSFSIDWLNYLLKLRKSPKILFDPNYVYTLSEYTQLLW